MPLGGLDRALLAKNGVWLGLGAVIIIGLVIWGIVGLFGSSASAPRAPLATPSPP